MKKIIVLLLILLIIQPMINLDIYASNAFGDFTIENNTLVAYYGNSENVIIPEGVVEIGRAVFSGCDFIKSVQIPDSVICIESEAFSNCSSLSQVSMPDSVVFIGKKAFFGCEYLKTVVFSKNLAYFEKDALEATEWKSKQSGDFIIVGDGVLIDYYAWEQNIVIQAM